MKNRKLVAAVLVVVLAVPIVAVAVSVLLRTGGPAGASAPAARPAGGTETALLFSGAAGWRGGRGGCTEVDGDPRCDSQWRHDGGQVARVFIADVPDPRALDGFLSRLQADVTAKGGVVEQVTQADLQIVRFLQPLRDERGGELASLNYAIVSRDRRGVHLVTSVVPFAEQQSADVRLRGLLDTAGWSAR